MNVTNSILVPALGCDPFTAVEWNEALNAAMEKFEINTPSRVAAFLAQIGVESNGLKSLVENMNYTTARLAVVWPGRYAENPHAVVKVPNPKAYELGGHPQALANDVYANRLGNGAPGTNDGWNFRGQGPIQSTGRANAEAAKKATGVDFVGSPEEFQKPEGGSMAAAFFFQSRGCNELADKGLIDAITEKVNGQPACAENKGDVRRGRYNAALTPLDDLTKPATAPKPNPKPVLTTGTKA